MNEKNYRPNGEVQGDSRPMPDRGVSTGVTDTYEADLSGDAINRMGGMGRAAKSDPADECMSGEC